MIKATEAATRKDKTIDKEIPNTSLRVRYRVLEGLGLESLNDVRLQ